MTVLRCVLLNTCFKCQQKQLLLGCLLLSVLLIVASPLGALASGHTCTEPAEETSLIQIGLLHQVGPKHSRQDTIKSVPTVVIDRAVGITMPLVAMGTWPPSLPQDITSSELTDALLSWVSLGGRHIDTAYYYEEVQPFNQQAIGKAVATAIEKGLVSRDQLFITSKVNGPIGYEATKQQVLEKTRPHLGLEYIDLLLVHWPCPGLTGFDRCSGEEFLAERIATWRALEELRAAGVVRSIGVSNFHVRHLETLFKGVHRETGQLPNLTVNQIKFNVGYHDEADFIWCQQHNITVEAYSPLGGKSSKLSATSAPPVVAAAEAHNVSSVQVALRWILQRGAAVITSSTNPAHQAEDLNPLFDFTLTSAEMAELTNYQNA